MTQVSVKSSKATQVPNVNELIRVTVSGDGDGDLPMAASAASRVEDVVLDVTNGLPVHYLVAAPVFPGDLERPPTGSPCELEWLTERGLCSLPARFESVEHGPRGLRLWRLAVTGTVTRHERRRYVRAPWALPAALAVRDRAASDLPDLPEAYHVTAINVSEGGLLCTSSGLALPRELPLIAQFTIGEKSFEIPSSVVWSTPRESPGGPPRVKSAIEFDNPSQQGDVLRPLIFQEQLRLRRAGLA